MRGLKEDYKQEALFKSLLEHEKISESAENYIRTLLRSRDFRDLNGHGIDAIDTSFAPPIYYEIKTGVNNVKIFDTQFHYQFGNNRYYLIMVKREDGLESHIRSHSGHKILKIFSLEESLLFNFGDICILPFEVVKEHYITQGAKILAKNDKESIKRYKYLYHLIAEKRERVKNEIERIIERQRSNEEIPHQERDNVALPFNQAKQIIVGCGEHFNLLKRSKSFRKVYKNNFRVIPGPYVDINKKDTSNIFIMDYDDIIINEIIKRLTEKNYSDKTRIDEMNEIKRRRLELYEEIQARKKRFEWSTEQDPNLEERLLSLSKWQMDVGPLFSQDLGLKKDLPF